MRIAYCTNVRLPSERAHGHQISQVCDALVHLGHEVDLYAPHRKNVVGQDYWTYYGADKAVRLHHLGSYDFIASPLPGVTKLWAMNASLRSAYTKELPSQKFDLLYTRVPALLPALLKTGVPVVLELHQLPRLGRSAFVRNCNKCTKVACLTAAMRDTLVSWGVKKEVLIAEGDAVDLRRFASLPSMADARKAFGITTERMVVGYVGRLKTLGMEKGVGHLLNVVAALKSEKKFFVLIVGGPESDRKQYEAKARALGLGDEDVKFTGEIEAKNVPASLAACDVLAMPFPDVPHYRNNMSPLKMFEYMAAGKPIVTSDLPTVREVLSETTASFCVPGDDVSLATAFTDVVAHPAEAAKRADAAKELVQRHTWEERMRRILSAATIRHP